MLSALYKLFGLQYIQQVLTDMLGISTASSIQLPIEVKSAVIDALVGILMPRPNHDSVVLSSGSTSLAKNGFAGQVHKAVRFDKLPWR